MPGTEAGLPKGISLVTMGAVGLLSYRFRVNIYSPRWAFSQNSARSPELYHVGATLTTTKKNRPSWFTTVVATGTELLDLTGPPGSLKILTGERTPEQN